MNETKVKQIIDSIILDVKTRGWKFNRTTNKAIKELRELGLEECVPSYLLVQDSKYDAIVNEIIKQAKDSGGKYASERTLDGEGTGYTTTASALYQALNEVEETPEEPTLFELVEALETVYPEIIFSASETFGGEMRCDIDSCKDTWLTVVFTPTNGISIQCMAFPSEMPHTKASDIDTTVVEQLMPIALDVIKRVAVNA